MAIPVDQLMCIKCVVWRISYFNTNRAILFSLTVIHAFFLFNIHLIFYFKHEFQKNITFIDACINSKIMVSWLYVTIIDFFFTKMNNKIFLFLGSFNCAFNNSDIRLHGIDWLYKIQFYSN